MGGPGWIRAAFGYLPSAVGSVVARPSRCRAEEQQLTLRAVTRMGTWTRPRLGQRMAEPGASSGQALGHRASEAGLVDAPELRRWSSFRAYAYQEKKTVRGERTGRTRIEA